MRHLNGFKLCSTHGPMQLTFIAELSGASIKYIHISNVIFSINLFNYEHYSLSSTNKKGFVRQDSCIEFTSFYCSDIPQVQSINCNNYIKTLEKHLCDSYSTVSNLTSSNQVGHYPLTLKSLNYFQLFLNM